MDIKNRNNVFLGDSDKSLKQIMENSMVLIIFWYDVSPANLIGIELVRVDSNEVSHSMLKGFAKARAFVKDKSNSISKTREEVVRVNKVHRTPALHLNNCSNSDSDNRQIQLKLNISRLATA